MYNLTISKIPPPKAISDVYWDGGVAKNHGSFTNSNLYPIIRGIYFTSSDCQMLVTKHNEEWYMLSRSDDPTSEFRSWWRTDFKADRYLYDFIKSGMSPYDAFLMMVL